MQQRPKSAEEAREVLANLPTDEDIQAEVQRAYSQRVNLVKAGQEEQHLHNQRAEKLYEVFFSGARNRFLRSTALVEYRCARGCFLGAVLPHDGERWIATRRNYGYLPYVVQEPEDVSLFYPATPGEATRIPEGERRYAPNSVLVETWERFIKEPRPNMHSSPHCAHTSCQFVPEEIEADIRRLRRKDKRVVRLPRAHS